MAEFVVYEEEFQQIKTILYWLKDSSNARLVFLVDRNGSLIAFQGDSDNVDTTSLASLTAGNVAATDGLAKLIGEPEFKVLYHEGTKDHIYITCVGNRIILLVIFDNHSSLGLVRLRVRKASEDLEMVFKKIMDKLEKEKEAMGTGLESPFAEITDEDIDSLFSE